MPDWTEADGLKWRALAPFGVLLDHDLSQPFFARETAMRFVSLFNQHGLIIATGQTLSLEQQRELMALLGPVLEDEDHSGTSSEFFQSEYAFTPATLEAISLYAPDLMEDEISTRFAHAERAYRALTSDELELLSTHDVEMIALKPDDTPQRACDVQNPDALARTQRHGIIPNPRTRRPCIGVDERHAAQLIGMEWTQSRDALLGIFDVLYAPENVLGTIWQKGDLIVWDNVSVHYAGASSDSLQRVAVGKKT